MIYSMFLNPALQGFQENVDDPVMANSYGANQSSSRFNVLWQRSQQVTLANAATYIVTPPKLVTATDKALMLVRVVGSARVNVAAKDFNGSDDVSGAIPVYGVARFPGIGVFSTYNLVSLTLESLADDTVIDIFTAVTCDDNDARLDTHA